MALPVRHVGAILVFSPKGTFFALNAEFFFENRTLRQRHFAGSATTIFYDSALAIGTYECALAASVIQLKHAPQIPQTLRKRLNSAFQRSRFYDTTLIVPVPLSPKRFRERGFNQAEVIANALAAQTGINVDCHSLIRVVHTPMHRAAMDKKARETTVRKAFRVVRPKLIAGQNILLIDDVFTSGSTVSYCAKELKKNGAGKVNVLTLARAG